MKTINLILITLLLVVSTTSYCQKDLSDYENIEGVYITSYWGNINVIGTTINKNKVFNIEAKHTDTSKNPVNINDLSSFVSFEVIKKKLFIQTRKPNGFESIDLNLKIPENLFLEIELLKGGEIYAQNLKNGVEINTLNGSVKLERIGKYALVNASNGEIDTSFDTIDKNHPISLVTINGGVTVALPDTARRDLRLISRKNGYIESDFNIDSDKKIINLNSKQYSRQPIINTARINGGGSLLFLSTENGPIAIKKLQA